MLCFHYKYVTVILFFTAGADSKPSHTHTHARFTAAHIVALACGRIFWTTPSNTCWHIQYEVRAMHLGQSAECLNESQHECQCLWTFSHRKLMPSMCGWQNKLTTTLIKCFSGTGLPYPMVIGEWLATMFLHHSSNFIGFILNWKLSTLAIYFKPQAFLFLFFLLMLSLFNGRNNVACQYTSTQRTLRPSSSVPCSSSTFDR